MRGGQKRTAALALAVGGLAATLVACGSGGGAAAGGPAKAGLAASAGSGPALAVRTTSLGQVLTSDGRTIYLLTSDKPGHPACTGSCLNFWPPVKASSAPSGGSQISATLAVSHGQLTVDGHPAYTYAGDSGAGQVNGEGVKSFGGVWWAFSSAGKPVTSSGGATSGSARSGDSSGGNSSGGGYGY